ncbi:hypothetical protein FFI94_022130 [Rhodococcus sp. KBS0724]|uniref:hypothetical protein n=1 Tax=Rhodococcus sp. KBS0724 TaxID=1179674 RepID=UPI00110E4940|nr:hypothetical protein [Rhodococcus sp. KBS0724]TSD48565.1 hypothetical protein FFI94_022130 [Rhodococcus sp. KBS0724]
MKATSTYECHVCNHTVHAGDEIYLVGGDLRCEKCSPRINTTQIIPDGGPMRYDRDFAFAETATEANLKITAKRWLPSETTPSIPYDEMRRLCGLPDVSAYIARRDAERAWIRLNATFAAFGEAFLVVGKELDKSLEPLRQFVAAVQVKPKHTPPMWAVVPGHSPRTRNRATDIRTPFR